jgi:GNAT superfamily N-acetyltransferase
VLLAATPDHEAFLRGVVLVEAAFPNGTRPPTDALADDHVVRYIEGWGRPGDLGLVAWDGDRPVGAAWTRLMAPERPGYGFVAPDVPELTVGVVRDRRGQGLGRALVAGALDLAAVHGHERVSLSVADEVNPGAAHLYRALGFVDVGRDDGGSMTMVASARPGPATEADSHVPKARLALAEDGPALARLRQVMFAALDVVDERDWVAPLLAMWPEERERGAWAATVVDDSRGRPIASAMALIHLSPPGPGRPGGRVAHVGSVATEDGWRRRGAARAAVTALLGHLDALGVESSTLNGSPAGSGLYRSLGFTSNDNVAMRRARPTP